MFIRMSKIIISNTTEIIYIPIKKAIITDRHVWAPFFFFLCYLEMSYRLPKLQRCQVIYFVFFFLAKIMMKKADK